MQVGEEETLQEDTRGQRMDVTDQRKEPYGQDEKAKASVLGVLEGSRGRHETWKKNANHRRKKHSEP